MIFYIENIPLNLSHISKDFFPQLKVHKINFGNCFNWSYIAYLLYKEQFIIQFWSVERFGGHAFLKINNKFYDSESPAGISNWRELNFFKGLRTIKKRDAIQQTKEEFLNYWKQYGKNRQMLYSIDELVKNYKEKQNGNNQGIQHLGFSK